MAHGDFLQSVQTQQGGRGIFPVGQPDMHGLSQVTEVNSHSSVILIAWDLDPM